MLHLLDTTKRRRQKEDLLTIRLLHHHPALHPTIILTTTILTTMASMTITGIMAGKAEDATNIEVLLVGQALASEVDMVLALDQEDHTDVVGPVMPPVSLTSLA